MVKTIIKEQKLKYAIPVYDINFVIDDRLFLDVLLMEIRGKYISFSSHLKNKQNERELNLTNEIQNLETNQLSNNTQELLNEKQAELRKIRQIKMKGNFVRSRATFIEEGEKPTKYFLGLE